MNQLEISVTQGQNDNKEEARAQGFQAASQARLKLICTKLADPKYQASEVIRIITVELASVVERMFSLAFTAEELDIRSWLAELVKALRALTEQIMDADRLRKKEDVLNFDGQAFKYVVGEIMRLFQEALKEAGVEESLRHGVMVCYRDLLAINEPQIRSEVEALEG